MKASFVLGCLGLLLACDPARFSTAPIAPAPRGDSPASPRVDFATQIRPLLESRCQPCHFVGGTKYAQLPFDREKTIRDLGEKLFTRIQQKEDQALIRGFLTKPVGPETRNQDP